ncbi:MAG TPA: thioredoxin fold domain-containing protein [Candidatus Dormibacteraeota bacterium]|nr:thioredoxin fold domain-containing protein [Candidatus Dormibacteraeota bacterium]
MSVRRLWLGLALAFVALTLGSYATARADQLVMFEQVGCPYCAAWNRDIGPSYNSTDEGKHAPLRRVDLHAPRPADLQSIKGVIYTPTFVLMHCGNEVARITGYSGAELFWELLDVDMQKLRAEPPCKG